MTTGGWVMLILSWGFILSLAAFCFTRILTGKAAGKKTAADNP